MTPYTHGGDVLTARARFGGDVLDLSLIHICNPATLTGQALEAIGDSPVLVGAPRLLEPWGAEHDCVPLLSLIHI